MRGYTLQPRRYYAYDSADLGVTPGVTTVAGTPLTNSISFAGYRYISGQITLTVPAGSIFRLRFYPQTYAGIAGAVGGPFFDIGFAASGSNPVFFCIGPGFLNNGLWDNQASVVSSGNFSTMVPLVGAENVTVQLSRSTGAGTATIDLFNLQLRG